MEVLQLENVEVDITGKTLRDCGILILNQEPAETTLDPDERRNTTVSQTLMGYSRYMAQR